MNWFRGDDEVRFYCEGCAVKQGKVPPPTKAERRLVAFVGQLKSLDRKIAAAKRDIPQWEKVASELRDRIANEMASKQQNVPQPVGGAK